VDPAAVSRSGRRGLVEQVESRQHEDYAKIYVRVNDLVSRYRTYTRDEGREIVLVLEEEEITALPEPTPRGKLRVKVQDRPVDVTHPIDVRTVVIDPGHGGVDVGRVGPNGTLEKDVNLAVAKELKRELGRNSDIEVVLTRERDDLLGLSERAEIANKVHGDLFISLHCNGWFNASASGVETYFLSPAESDWSKSVAATENQGLESSDVLPEDVTFIVWELVQNKFISSSSDLAEIVQSQLVQRGGAADRGVRQAGFRVLVGAYMPAVLVELGFLSNPNEERKLRDRSYQRDLARALSDAIVLFKERYAQTAQTIPPEDEEW
jgi:N-acetylmuramoyl-L-alanine amidase